MAEKMNCLGAHRIIRLYANHLILPSAEDSRMLAEHLTSCAGCFEQAPSSLQEALPVLIAAKNTGKITLQEIPSMSMQDIAEYLANLD